MDKIGFNPEDRNTVALLHLIGLTDEKISRGEIPGDYTNLPFALVKFFASHSGDDTFLSPHESEMILSDIQSTARYRLGITQFTQVTQLSEKLLKDGSCPTTGEPYTHFYGDERDGRHVIHVARIMFENLTGRNYNTTAAYERFTEVGVTPLDQCPYNPNIPTDLYAQIHFPDEQVPSEISSYGKAVGLLGPERGISGSAVMVSKEGHILSAWHLLFLRETGECRCADPYDIPLFVVFGTSRFRIKPEHIVAVDEKRDLVLIQIPEAMNLPYLTIANTPPQEGEQIWHIGFPEIKKEARKEKGDRLYMTSRVARVEKDWIHGFATLYPGYSGGATIDSRGRLLGINHAHEASFDGPISFGSVWIGHSIVTRLDSELPHLHDLMARPSNDWRRGKYLHLESGAGLQFSSSVRRDIDPSIRAILTPLEARMGCYGCSTDFMVALEAKLGDGPLGQIGRLRVGLETTKVSDLGIGLGIHGGSGNVGDLIAGAAVSVFFAKLSGGRIRADIDYERGFGLGRADSSNIFSLGLGYHYDY